MSLLILVAIIWLQAPSFGPNLAGAEDPPKAVIPSEYEPSPAYPFGRRNPQAPPELAQFEFMVGEFDCVDRLRRPDGSWAQFPSIWNASYFLNGHGIQDQYWSPPFSTSNIRIYDPQQKMWLVTFFKMPGYGSGVWPGRKEGDDMVMRQENQRQDTKVVSQLTFHNIKADGFEWKSETIVGDQPASAGWTSACQRRR